LGGCRWTRGTIRSRSSAHTTSSGGKYAAGVLEGYSRGTRGVLEGTRGAHCFEWLAVCASSGSAGGAHGSRKPNFALRRKIWV
jgi:hypothetical protein